MSKKVEELKEEIRNKAEEDLKVVNENSKAYKEDQKEANVLGKKITQELDREAKEEASMEKEFAKELEVDMKSGK
ncbi:hypothetical protein UT300003_24030 [Clostridium sardiniense]